MKHGNDAPKPLCYYGIPLKPEDGGGCAVSKISRNGVRHDLNPRLSLANHSPDGFEWGYEGSGPAQLALAILATRLPDAEALELYQRYKREVISRLERGKPWAMTGQEVDAWVWAQGEAEKWA